MRWVVLEGALKAGSFAFQSGLNVCSDVNKGYMVVKSNETLKAGVCLLFFPVMLPYLCSNICILFLRAKFF